ncbi:MAG: ribosome assembly RNA-binding protein YhbY [Armatimonadota bacterium]
MALTGKQKRVLRSRGQLLEPVVFIGKEGVSEAAVASTEEALHTRELIKVRVLKAAPYGASLSAGQLAEATGGEVAGSVGHTFLLYRANPDAKERIELPPS